jgi:hypothetical protein
MNDEPINTYMFKPNVGYNIGVMVDSDGTFHYFPQHPDKDGGRPWVGAITEQLMLTAKEAAIKAWTAGGRE